MKQIETKFIATESSGEVSALLLAPESPKALLILGHGAGAGMHHPSMEGYAQQLLKHDIATFRYQFPYMEQGKPRPNPAPISEKTVRSAVKAAGDLLPDIPLFAGGKSYGGRMTSQAQSAEPLQGVNGIIFFGFPLHAPGKQSNDRAEHLYNIHVPLLFLQGTRDSLANLDYLKPVCDKLGKVSTLHIVEGGDHSFKVPKSSGKGPEDVLDELGNAVNDWIGELLGQ